MFTSGQLVRRAYRPLRPGDTMDVYTFEGWVPDVPSSERFGRVAALRWEHNGTRATGWELELSDSCSECGELLDDRDSGCDTCVAFTFHGGECRACGTDHVDGRWTAQCSR